MTERAEHTAGPWFVAWKHVVGPRSDADDQSFGMVIGVCDVYGDNEDADARLIAAAPDLLAALQTLSAEEWRDDDDPILSAARNQARAAISRATGEA